MTLDTLITDNLPVVVYLAGAISAPTHEGVMANVERAEATAMDLVNRSRLAEMPAAVHVPHGTARWPGSMDPALYPHWLLVDLAIMARCDAVVLVAGWEQSKGTLGEIAHADAWGIPVFDSVDAYLAGTPRTPKE